MKEKRESKGMHPHHQGGGMSTFNREHWEKDPGDIEVCNLKYTSGEMSNPEHLKKSVDALSSYVKKNKMPN